MSLSRASDRLSLAVHSADRAAASVGFVEASTRRDDIRVTRDRTGWPATRRAVAVAAAMVVVALLSSGCSAAGGNGGASTRQGAPKAGDCWTTTFAASQKTEDWEGHAAVSCATAHQSYTYAVATISRKLSYSSWLDSSGGVRQDVDKAAYAACHTQQSRILPGITEKEALLYPTYYLPSTTQWGDGARWVRCDISEVKVGSTIAAPKLANLAGFAELKSTLSADPKRFALCEDDPANNGPDGAQTTYADCTGPADWTFIAALTMAGTDGAPYPGLTQLKTVGATQCATLKTPAGHEVFVEPPTQADWTKYDDRELDCWLNNN